MSRYVLKLIRQMHLLGICHRDLHDLNLLVQDGKPLVIDLEHAAEVDPSWPCYDLYGPSEMVPLLAEHRAFGGVLGSTGIWWDAEHDERFGLVTMAMIFGPLGSLEVS